MEIEVIRFMMVFTLFVIIEANAFMVPVRISL